MSERARSVDMIVGTALRGMEEDKIAAVMRRQQRLPPGWYAASGSIGLQSGPYDTEQLAREAMRLHERARAKQRLAHGTDYPYPYDLHVWEET